MTGHKMGPYDEESTQEFTIWSQILWAFDDVKKVDYKSKSTVLPLRLGASVGFLVFSIFVSRASRWLSMMKYIQMRCAIHRKPWLALQLCSFGTARFLADVNRFSIMLIQFDEHSLETPMQLQCGLPDTLVIPCFFAIEKKTWPHQYDHMQPQHCKMAVHIIQLKISHVVTEKFAISKFNLWKWLSFFCM